MKILAISGSASEKSSNTLLLKTVQQKFGDQYDIEVYENLRNLPLFRPEDLEGKLPDGINEFKNKVIAADSIIISTPEYTHNIPAIVKSAFEWMTASGELNEKKVLPITFTPHEPRGQWAMKSLLFSLKTMNVKVVTQLPLYKSDVTIEDGEMRLNEEMTFMLEEALKLLED